MRLALVGILLMFSFAARADFKNHNLLPMGEKEAFRGNAGTGVRGSAGAPYYNPAGLASLKSSQISLSGTTFVYFDSQTDKLIYLDSTDLSYKEFGFATVPAALVAVWGGETWVYAFSLISTGTATYKNWATWDTPNTRTYFSRFAESSETWVGLSAARELGPFWSAGFTLFGVRSSGASLSTIQSRATTTTIFKLLTVTNMTQSNVYNMVGTLGLHYRASSSWEAGLRVQSPSVKLSGKTDIHGITEFVGPFGNVTPTENNQDQVDTNLVMPLDLTLGVSIWPNNPFRLFLDVSHQSATAYDTLPGSPNNQKIDYSSMIRYNLGAEWLTGETGSINAGLFYNPSALQVVHQDGEAKADYNGATLGYFHSGANTSLGVGIYYIWANGETVTFISSEKSPMQSRIAGLSLTTGYRF